MHIHTKDWEIVLSVFRQHDNDRVLTGAVSEYHAVKGVNMIKTVRSFFIVELRTSLPHKLPDSEYSDRRQAEVARKVLIKMHPKARIREQEALYDLRQPEELLRYKAHLLRLK